MIQWDRQLMIQQDRLDQDMIMVAMGTIHRHSIKIHVKIFSISSISNCL